MDPAALADLLAKTGPYGVIAGLLYALRWAIKRGDAANEALIKLGNENAALAARTTIALNKSNVLIEEAGARVRATDLRLNRGQDADSGAE